MDWEKMFANHISDERLTSRIYKDPLQLNNKTEKFKNEQRTLIQTLVLVKKYMKRCPTLVIIREIQTKTTVKNTPYNH